MNDVAEVNIDNKLIVGNSVAGQGQAQGQGRSNEKPAGIVELSNGCACCSLADELLPAVSELITLSDLRCQGSDDSDSDNAGYGFDHIVIELSGVASPKSIRSNFQDAEFYGMPLMDRVRLDTMVTVVDCSTFLHHLRDENGKLVNEEESPDLFFRTEEERQQRVADAKDAEEDLWLELERGKAHSETTTISKLLVEQTEISDIVLLNKVDTLLEDDETSNNIDDIQNIVSALNSRATVYKTKFGIVDKIEDVVGAAKGLGIVDAGITDDHRDSIEAVKAMEEVQSHAIDIPICKDKDCTDESHSHSHSHSHGDEDEDETGEQHKNEVCTDISHSHSHEDGDREEHKNEVCNDESHSHSHSHKDEEQEVCADPACSDTSHSHTHAHSHSHEPAMPGGIGTFIFQARRPFHPERLLSVVGSMPVVRGLPPKNDDESPLLSTEQKKVFGNIIRSKGFCWLADSHVAAMYWSHAGSSFEMQCLGRWWATLPKDQWPEEAVEEVLVDFDDIDHDEFGGDVTTVGDRRQEVVLIGPGLGDGKSRELIKDALQKCLLNDVEYENYQGLISDENQLKTTFQSPFPVQMLTY